MVDCLIGFGSNMGDSRATYQIVADCFDRAVETDLVAVSKLIKTAPVGGPEQQAQFFNGAVRIQTTLNAQDLHRLLIEVESSLGRVKRERWGARIVDLDLLLYGDHLVCEQNLMVPHPRMSFRRFVLEPAFAIAAEMIHPVTGLSVKELLERINQQESLIRWVTKNSDQAREITNQMGDVLADWSVEITSLIPEHAQVKPKLVVWDMDYEASSTNAPTLFLEGYSQQQKLIEFRAAVNAIAKI